jgi:4-phytase/acid phosphatase
MGSMARGAIVDGICRAFVCRGTRRAAGWLLPMLLLSPLMAAAEPADRLERVVILMRHGVRAAMASPTELQRWNGRPWPAFAVPPGQLTGHGERLVTLLGHYYRTRYRAAGLLTATDCAVFYHANTPQRTQATATALAQGLTPDCGSVVHRMPAGPDPLFDAPLTPIAPPDPAAIRAAMAGRIGGDLTAWDARQRAALKRFEALLLHCAATCTEADRARAPRRLDRTPIGWTRNADGDVEPTSPALQVAGIAESLMMGYADGHDFAAKGWGFDRAALTEALVVHGAGIDLRLHTPEVGRQASSYLARRIVATLRGDRGTDAAIGDDAKIVVLAGHDTTITMLAGLLGLDWLLPSYAAGQAVPGGALVFERWRQAGTGVPFVRVAYIAQGLDQMREQRTLTPADPPEIAAVAVPGCHLGPTTDCPLADFAKVVGSRIDRTRAGLAAGAGRP